jgi:hypothetical protein
MKVSNESPAMIAVERDAIEAASAQEVAARLTQLGQEVLDQLLIHEAERTLPLVDDRHLHPERCEDGRVLASEHARAQHHQRLRQVREREQRVAVQDVLVIDRHVVGCAR